MAADRTFVSCERIVGSGDFAAEGPLESIRVSRIFTDGVVEAPFGAHFTHCVPDYERDERFQREYAATAKDADAFLVRVGVRRCPGSRVPRLCRALAGGGGRVTAASLVDVCVVACAEAWRGDGEILASPIGVIPTLGARLAAR